MSITTLFLRYIQKLELGGGRNHRGGRFISFSLQAFLRVQVDCLFYDHVLVL